MVTIACKSAYFGFSWLLVKWVIKILQSCFYPFVTISTFLRSLIILSEKQVLKHLSVNWSSQRDSDPQPTHYKWVALPIELWKHGRWSRGLEPPQGRITICWTDQLSYDHSSRGRTWTYNLMINRKLRFELKYLPIVQCITYATFAQSSAPPIELHGNICLAFQILFSPNLYKYIRSDIHALSNSIMGFRTHSMSPESNFSSTTHKGCFIIFIPHDTSCGLVQTRGIEPLASSL